jgi:hypothetical protein
MTDERRVLSEIREPFMERQGLAMLALGRRDYALDLLVFTPQEVERDRAIPGSAIYWALEEGRRVDAL